MKTEQTIAIRKRVRIDAGLVAPAQGKAYGASMMARDISCTITVEVPMLTEVPDYGREDGAREVLISELQELGFERDDEIGILARAVPERCAFRKRTGQVVYRRASARLLEALGAEQRADATGLVLGLDSDGGYTFVEVDTPVVVRLCDVLDDYEPMEDK